jgi:hypothetical protein
MAVFVRESVKVTAHHVKARHLNHHYLSLRVDEAGLWLEGKLELPREEITATSLELDERTTVRVQGKKESGFSCTFTDPKVADELLVALGREPARVAAMVSLEPSLLTMGFHPLPLWKALASVAIAMVAMVALLPFVARAGGFGSLGRLGRFVGRTLELGTDGLRIRTVGGDEFVAYREITKAEARGEILHLIMRDGRECALPLSNPRRAMEVIARIAQSIAVPEPTADAVAATLLREVVGDKAARVAALRELAAESAGTYREARLPRERLWQLLEDPHVDGATRTRAAVALSGALEPGDRRRLRIATDATVSPRVRIALDTLEHEDDARLADQLEALDEENLPGEPQPVRQRA